MGLDMYLTRRVYISNYDHAKAEERALAKGVMDALGIKNQDLYKGSGITVELPAAYWRKANAIHQWFVENVQGGEDECEPHDVSREQLQQLRDLCANVLSGKQGSDDLPPQEGFFFGPTDDKEWYNEYLTDTVKMLDDVLNPANNVTERDGFQYCSSW